MQRSVGGSKAETPAKRGFASRSPRRTGLRDLILELHDQIYRRVAVRLATSLPMAVAYAVAVQQGDIRYMLNRSLRDQVESRLEDVLNEDQATQEYTSVVRRYFRLRSCEVLDMALLSGESKEISRLVEVRGRQHIEAAQANGKGALICTAHFGHGPNCVALLSAMGYPSTLVARWAFGQRGGSMLRPVDNWILAHHAPRPNILDRPGDVTAALKAATLLRKNELVSVLIDATVRSRDHRRSVPVSLMNRRAYLLPGVVTISKLTGAPILMTLMRRGPDWRHQVIEISSPVSVEGDPSVALQRCIKILEREIRRDPAQWTYWGGSYWGSISRGKRTNIGKKELGSIYLEPAQ